MKLEPQIEKLYQTLDRELDNFPSGTKFFSTRKLMDKFKCHRGVLDEVLDRLEANRLIDRIPQVGIFSRVTRRPNAHKVLFAVPDWPSEDDARMEPHGRLLRGNARRLETVQRDAGAGGRKGFLSFG